MKTRKMCLKKLSQNLKHPIRKFKSKTLKPFSILLSFRYNFFTTNPTFPFRIRHVSSHFLEGVINSPIRFESTIDYSLPFSISDCNMKFFFKKLSKSALDTGFNPTFASSLGVRASITFRFIYRRQIRLFDLLAHQKASLPKKLISWHIYSLR